jgi:YidC/Oxa1 family membrane protein insertase
MEWRAVLAVVLSIVVLVVWQYVFVPTREPPQRPAPPETQEKPANEPTTQAPRVTIPGRPSTPAAPETGSGRETPLQTLSERLRTANFTPSASQLTVTAQQPSGAVRFEYQDPTGWHAVKTFELHDGSYALDVGVTLAKPGAAASPTPVAGMDAERPVILENDLLRIVMTTRGARIKELLLKKYAAPWTTSPNIEFHWNSLWGGSGASTSGPARHGESAVVNLIAAPEDALPPAVEVSADGQHALMRWGPGLSTDPTANGNYTSLMTFVNGERWLDKPKPGQPPVERTGNIQWTAMQDKYYAIAVIPRSSTEWTALHQGTNPADYAIALGWPLNAPVTETHFSVYTGPKELKRLAAIDANGRSLAELVHYNYGWVRVLRPDLWLLRPLQWLYGITHNYGIAIIMITVAIKLLFYPLSVKSFKSMQAMQHLQPQIKRLQDIYKNDRQKLNEEMMRLYREQKVNPMGGCLPMVVQVPVFIALYQVLYTSIELRHAEFFWWIKDLSAPDHPMALIMGASMVVQQWMTPSTGDPRQAKMMLFMPIIFTFMFLNFPVGLVIYWLVNNLLTIAQQYVMLRQHRPASQTVGGNA